MRAASNHNRSRPSARRATAALGTTTVLVVGALTSCSGPSSSAAADGAGERTHESVDAQEWRRVTDRRCSEVSEQYEDLAVAEPSDRDGAMAHLERVRSFATDLVEAQPGTLPRGEAVDGMELLDGMDELAGTSSKLAAAAEDGDSDAVGELSAEVAEIGGRINEQAIRLGVDSCGGL